jgi:hypothetical protein
MLIVEGPDGAGKTTMVNRLEKHLEWPVSPRVVSKETEGTADLKDWVERNVKKGFQQTIFDRHRLLSEPIYGPVLRGTSQYREFYDVSWFTKQMGMFIQAQPIIIYCLPSIETVMLNLVGDDDNLAVVGSIDRIYRGYVSQYAMLSASDYTATWLHDYTTDSPQAVLDWVDAELEANK